MEEAEKLLGKMIDLSKTQGYKALERKASSYLSRVYVDSGDLKKASIVISKEKQNDRQTSQKYYNLCYREGLGFK